MGISFLNPLFLIGLTALVIPVLVHLVQSHRADRIRFPSIMFLDKILFQTLRRSKIRNWILFLMRAFAFALIVLAFARPILGGGAADLVAASGARDLVILLDGSYSMSYTDRWELAVGAARRALEGLGAGERAGIVLFAEGAELASPLSGDRGQLRSILESLSPTDRATRFGPALELARQLLEESEQPRREVLLISDFQRIGWQDADTPPLPSWLILTPVDLSEPDYSNAAVASVQLQRRADDSGSLLTLTARLLNHGTRELSGLEVSLQIDGRERGRRELDIGANGLGSVSFDEVSLTDSEVRGTVTVTEEHLPADNSFRFVLSPASRLRVLVVEGENARSEESLFIQRALAIGDRPSFSTEVVGTGAADAYRIENSSLIILNGTAEWGAGNARRLLEFVEQGGGLLVVLGEAGRRSSPDSRADRLMPMTGRSAVEVPDASGRVLGELDYDNPVFEIFSEPRSGDFTTARFCRYHELAGDWGGSVIARFDDGSPALLEKRIGGGMVLVWTSTLDNYWNDLALKPVFLPFVHQIARHATGYRDYREWHTVGETLEFLNPGDLTQGAVRAATPSGEEVELVDSSGNLLLTLEEPGFYELENLPQGWEAPRAIAVNRNRAESDLEPLDIEEFMLVTSTVETAVEEAGLDPAIRPEVAERRQSVWWYLLLAVGMLLGIETITANRLSLKGDR